MEDFFELEVFLKGLDEAQPENLCQDSELKLDDNQHTSRKYLKTSPKASIDRNRQLHIYRHHQPDTDRHHPPDIDQCPLLDEPPCFIVEMEFTEDKMHKYEALNLVVHEHLRSPICTEEATGINKRVKRMHDHVKFVVPTMGDLRCRGEVDKGPAKAASIDTDQIPSIAIGRVSEQKKFKVCQNIFDGDTTTRSDKFGGKKMMNQNKRKMIKGDTQLSLIPHFSVGVMKSRVRSRCFLHQFAKFRALLIDEMINKGEESMEALTKTWSVCLAKRAAEEMKERLSTVYPWSRWTKRREELLQRPPGTPLGSNSHEGLVKGPDPVSLTAGLSSVRLSRPKLALYEIFPLLTIFNQLSSKSQHDQIRNRIPLFLSHSANQPSRTDSTLAMLSAPEPVTDHRRISQHTLGPPALDPVSTPHGHHPIQVSVQS
ncbi:hypothetical protein YC2023_045532 [Brassica napus]